MESSHKGKISKNVNIYYVAPHCKILSLKADSVSGSLWDDPTAKVIVLRDYLELSESPQHSMYPHEAYQSISQVVEAGRD